jgi:CHAT domain-containing protein/Flp pilus assembly protein TadD
VRLEDDKGNVLAENDDVTKDDLNSRIVFRPKVAAKYRLVVTSYEGGATGAYRLTVRPESAPKLAPPARVFRGELGAKDPPDPVLKKVPHRVHEIDLEAGKAYVIDLASKDFDAFLRIEDAKGKPLGSDDNAGGGTDARLAFTVRVGATYRLIATAAPKGEPRGAYTLTVRLDDPRARALRELKALTAAGARHIERGDPEAAEPVFRRALALCRQLYPRAQYPRGHMDLAHSLAHLGGALQALGKWDEARTHYEEILAIQKQLLPRDHPDLGHTLHQLGALLVQLGRLQEGRSCLERAVVIDRKTLRPGDPDLAVGLSNLGLALLDLGKLAEAASHLEEALAIFRKALPPDHPDLGSALHNLAAVLRAQGKLDAARTHLEGALAIFRKARPPDPQALARGLSNLGDLLAEQGKPAAALEYIEQAVAALRKALPHDHPDLACGLNNLGSQLSQMGRRDEARRHLEEALAICKKLLPLDHPHQAIARLNLGTVLWATGQHDEGWSHLSGAAAAWAGYTRRLAEGSAQRDHPNLIRPHRVYLDRLLGAAAGDDLAGPRREEVLLRILECKGIGDDALGARREALLRQASPEARATAGQLLPLQRRLADLLLQGPGRLAPQKHRERCAELQREIDKLERALALRLQPYALVQRALAATPADLAARLGPGAVLIETVRFQPRDLGDGAAPRPPQYAAALLWPAAGGGAPNVRLVFLGDAAPIERAVAAWRAAIQQGQADPPAGRDLRRLLWGPLARALPEKTARLVVAPDGELALVPLEALKLGDGKYLIEHYQISYVSSGRDLMPRSARSREEGRPAAEPRLPLTAAVLADPDYDAGGPLGPMLPEAAPAGLKFARLPGFAREAKAVGALLGDRPGWRVAAARGAAASEEALAKEPRPRLLYLITHGFFLEDVQRDASKEKLRDLELVGPRLRLPSFGEDPRLRSGLALAGANQWQERSAKGLSDGLLTALEVENLDLWGTELVVLSACETGRGEVQVGEGVLGLRRAFQLAGAQTVLASLWKVPDAETERLMTDTLSRWLKGTPPHEALRQAQLEMIGRLRAEAPRPRGDAARAEPRGPLTARGLAPPLYWAGFICHGRPDR